MWCLHPHRERLAIGRLADQVEVIPLHGEVRQAKRRLVLRGLERLRERPEGLLPTQAPYLGPHPIGDVNRAALRNQSASLMRDGHVSLASAAGARRGGEGYAPGRGGAAAGWRGAVACSSFNNKSREREREREKQRTP